MIRQLVTGQAPWPLLLFGHPGNGKTCAALCLLDYSGGEYYTASRLCSDLIDAQHGRLTMRGEQGSVTIHPQNFWNRIQVASLVVLDELGARERVSDHHYEAVQRMLDDRAGKPLVCISNHPPDVLIDLYDARIYSRLAAGTVMHLQAKDRRLTP